MGNTSTPIDQEINTLLQQYQIIQTIPHQNLTFLEHKQTNKEYLLREMTYNDKKQYDKAFELLKKKKTQLDNSEHVVPLTKYITKSEDQFCSTFFKIYALFEYPQRTLDDQINERNLHKRKFQQKQLWSILASCILALSHLQKQDIKHSSLRSSTILLSSQGIIRIADPFTTGSLTNYDILLNKRDTQHIYLPPQQADSLQQEAILSSHNPYKADIWTLGMIMLEAGLLQYQDECYRDDGSRIHWETLNYNINRFGQTYSDQLKNMIEFMLSRDQRTRPQWIDLEQHVMKVDEDVRGPYITQDEQQRLSANKPKANNVITTTPPTQHLYHKLQNKNSRAQIITKPLPYNSSIYSNYPTASYRPLEKTNVTSQLKYYPVAISNIDNTRPLRSIFPTDIYIEHTKVDQNLVMVEQEEHSQKNNPSQYSPYKQQDYKHPLQVNIRNNVKPDYPYSYNSNYKNPQPNHRLTNNYHQPNHTNSTSQRMSNNVETPVILSSPKPQYKVEIFKMGSRYQGYQVNGMRHGKGKFYYQDGGMYDGDWNYNKMEGMGKLYYQSGILAYEGQWLKDQFTGYGVLYNQTPQTLTKPFNYYNLDQIDQYWIKYEGYFLEDNKHGKGKWYLSNGQFYNGEFKDDMAHGHGSFHTLNGKVIAGYWNRNQLMEQKR